MGGERPPEGGRHGSCPVAPPGKLRLLLEGPTTLGKSASQKSTCLSPALCNKVCLDEICLFSRARPSQAPWGPGQLKLGGAAPFPVSHEDEQGVGKVRAGVWR